MAHYVAPNEIYKRYETHHKKVINLYVTRQNQQFRIANDQTLCDLKLLRSSVELVGEPGFAGGTQVGYGHTQGAYDTLGASVDLVTPGYCSTTNWLYAMNKSGSSRVYGMTLPNGVQHKSTINHGWVDVSIAGMTEARHFMRDDGMQDNQVSLLLPTDSGILSTRAQQASGPPHQIVLENVKMDPYITVGTLFVGTSGRNTRIARFVEDFADTDIATYRSTDGSVKYYDTAGAGACQIPANMVTHMILQFEMTPRSTL